MDEVIATGMAKDPDNRYATTVALANVSRSLIPALGNRDHTLLPHAPPRLVVRANASIASRFPRP